MTEVTAVDFTSYTAGRCNSDPWITCDDAVVVANARIDDDDADREVNVERDDDTKDPTSPPSSAEIMTTVNLVESSDGNDVTVPTATFAERIFRTVCVYASYFAVALNLGIVGPSLMVLETITKSTTAQISIIFTCRGILAITGSLLVGPVLDRTNHYLLIGLALILDFIFYGVVPWCTSLPTVVIAVALPELCNCVIGMGSHLLCIGIWRSKPGPSLQLLNFTCIVGFMTAPLLVKLFLHVDLNNASDQRHSFAYNTSLSESYPVAAWNGDVTSVDPSTSSPSLPAANGSTGDRTFHGNLDGYTSSTTFAYLIVAIYSLLVGILMLGIFFFDLTHRQPRGSSSSDAVENKDEVRPAAATETSTDGKRLFVIKVAIVFFIFNFFYGGIEIGYAGLVSTFAVKFLGWSQDDGTDLTAVVQAANAIVTAVAACLTRYVKPQIFITSNVIVVFLSLGLLSVLVELHPAALWICTAMLGAGYASVMPSSFTWISSFMDLDGKFSSVYWCGYFAGFMAIPGFTGYMFNEYTPMWFPYSMLLSSVGMAVSYVALCALVHRNGRHMTEAGRHETRDKTGQDAI